jgi:twinkle protein
MLRELARDSKLRQLLGNEKLLRQMGIPRAKLAELLEKPDFNGMAGLSAVRALLYTLPPSDAARQAPEAATPAAAASANALQQPPAPTRPPPALSSPPSGMPSTPPPPPPSARPATPPASANGASTGSGAPPAAEAADTAPKRASIRDALNQQRIFPPHYSPGNYRVVCPKCKGGSKHEPSFSVTIEDDSKSAKWHCFRATCGYAGTAHVDKPAFVNESGFFVSPTARKRREEPPVRPAPALEPLTSEMAEFFGARGISTATLERNGVAAESVYDPGQGKMSKVIAFPYFR